MSVGVGGVGMEEGCTLGRVLLACWQCFVSPPGWGCRSIICISAHLYLGTYLCLLLKSPVLWLILLLLGSGLAIWGVEKGGTTLQCSFLCTGRRMFLSHLFCFWGRGSFGSFTVKAGIQILQGVFPFSYRCGQGSKNYDEETFLIQDLYSA